MTDLAHTSSPPPASTRSITLCILATFTLWGGTVTWLAATGVFAALYRPYIALLVAAGIVLPTLVYAASPSLRRYVATIGLYPLTILHIWRVPAALAFFWFGLAGQLPPVFWILAGTGDLIAGLYAAQLLRRQGDLRFYRRFHMFGFADFVVAVGAGLTFTLLSDPRMETITLLPMALIPLFGVGISGASHLIAFDQMRRWTHGH